MVHIVCFGDSNTWGFNPVDGSRFDEHTRWTGILQTMLGDRYRVAECGICGRTTVFDEPFREGRNGREGLKYTMLENSPIDLLVICLGTNDLKYTSVIGSGRGLRTLLRTALHSGLLHSGNKSAFSKEVKILVIAPIAIGKEFDERFPDSFFKGKYPDSTRFGEVYAPICKEFNVAFMDASEYAKASETDCIHMDADNHRLFAQAVYRRIKMLSRDGH